MGSGFWQCKSPPLGTAQPLNLVSKTVNCQTEIQNEKKTEYENPASQTRSEKAAGHAQGRGRGCKGVPNAGEMGVGSPPLRRGGVFDGGAEFRPGLAGAPHHHYGPRLW